MAYSETGIRDIYSTPPCSPGRYATDEVFSIRTFNSFKQRRGTTYPTEIKTQEVISKDLNGHMHILHVAIRRSSMAANMLHIKCTLVPQEILFYRIGFRS
ncbi:hypothetical protein AVEN_140255-1 [Araneus ventricosus]|uniref:Uncharacterized protein n=1 Tax=Araneus ventricosus TaxID=182803 RepID=A0A4Y2LU50_ARAVE|nr:hypothetical protein AVEN_140255-1 [Araneus ventricosus]